MSNNNNYRYEQKFLINQLSKVQVRQIVKLHPLCFKKIHHKRYINNIYFDYDNLYCYNSSVEGFLERYKIRIRWYGNLFTFIEKPILEIKIKKGLLSKKILIPLKKFFFDKKTDIKKIMSNNSFVIEQYLNNWKSLFPTLINRYLREYYLSFDKKYRVTIDNDQSFYSPLSSKYIFSNMIKEKNDVILEIKYNAQDDINANISTSLFPFRVTKSSKYIKGIELTLP